MNPNLSSYILCGGKSSRMQEEKGLVEYQGKAFVQWILEAVDPIVTDTVLVTKNPAYHSFQLELISDLIEDKGPLGGIFTALTHSQTELVLILSCDIPKINTSVLAFLVEKAKASPDQITFLSDGKNDYPLIGVYPKQLLDSFGKSILKNELKLRLLVQSLPYQRIELNPTSIPSLQNINTKAQLLSLSQTY